MLSIELFSSVTAVVGEGPVWDVAEQRLYWIDVSGKRLFRAAPDGRDVESWGTPFNVGSMCLREGGAIVAMQSGLYLFDFGSGQYDRIADPERGKSKVELNDGKVDPQGRFIVGSYDAMSFDESQPCVAMSLQASLYCLDAALNVHRIGSDVACVNGPCWSPDGSQFYFGDTVLGVVWKADWDSQRGTFSNKTPFITCGGDDGLPDGATCDAEGFYWGAFFGSGTVRRYAPDGTLDRVVELPVKKVTSVMFGGPELDTLYVTTMSDILPPRDGPSGGRLFAVRGLGIRGVAEPRFVRASPENERA